jgi:hypothetical protein
MDRPMSGRRTAALGLLLAAVVGISAIIPRPEAVREAAPWQCIADDAVAYARHLQANGVDEGETVAALKLHGYVIANGRWVCPNA